MCSRILLLILSQSVIFLHQFVRSTRDVSRASSLGDTRICPCQSARGGINYSNQRVLPAQLEICGRGARTRIPVRRAKVERPISATRCQNIHSRPLRWRIREERIIRALSAPPMCTHDSPSLLAGRVVSLERERKIEREGGVGRWKEKWSETFMYYIASEFGS